MLPNPFRRAQLWESRRRQLSLEAVRMRQRRLGELRRLATASRPDICGHSGSTSAQSKLSPAKWHLSNPESYQNCEGLAEGKNFEIRLEFPSG